MALLQVSIDKLIFIYLFSIFLYLSTQLKIWLYVVTKKTTKFETTPSITDQHHILETQIHNSKRDRERERERGMPLPLFSIIESL